jgi:hypothetical protein
MVKKSQSHLEQTLFFHLGKKERNFEVLFQNEVEEVM